MWTLSCFNTGQITLPKKWRSQFKSDKYIATETKNGLLIKPIIENKALDHLQVLNELKEKDDGEITLLESDKDGKSVYYEDNKGSFGLYFPPNKNGADEFFKTLENSLKKKKS